MNDVVLLEAARTPHGTLLGSLTDVEAREFGRHALDGLLGRAELPASEIEWVALGNAIQAGIGQVPGRQVVVESTLPDDTPATTINEASATR